MWNQCIYKMTTQASIEAQATSLTLNTRGIYVFLPYITWTPETFLSFKLTKISSNMHVSRSRHWSLQVQSLDPLEQRSVGKLRPAGNLNHTNPTLQESQTYGVFQTTTLF